MRLPRKPAPVRVRAVWFNCSNDCILISHIQIGRKILDRFSDPSIPALFQSDKLFHLWSAVRIFCNDQLPSLAVVKGIDRALDFQKQIPYYLYGSFRYKIFLDIPLCYYS